MNSIFNRKSIRRFKDTQVEPEKIELLMKAAMAAPTACNQRSWEYVVVDDPEVIKQLGMVTKYSAPAGNAPLVIVVVSNEDKYICPEYWEQDLGASTQNILVEAVELGLGAVWMGIAPGEERMKAVAEVVKLPENVKAFNLIAVGYPDEEPQIRWKYESERVHYNQY